MPPQTVVAQSTAQTAQRGVLVKLLLFSFSLAFVPISSYFASEKYLWDGNSVYAAITAVLAANLVLGAYIFTSILEDQKTTNVTPEKKAQ